MVVINDRSEVAPVMELLRSLGINLAQSWRGVLHHLALNMPVAFLLDRSISQEEYDLILQYQEQQGLIQLTESRSGDLITIHCDPSKARLLLLVSDEELKTIEREYEIMSHVGIIEYV